MLWAIIVALGAGAALVGLAVGYAVSRHDVGQRAATRAIIVGLPLLLVGLLFGFWLNFGLSGPWKDRASTAFLLLMSVYLLDWIALSLWRSSRAGELLLRPRLRDDRRRLFLVLSAFLLIGGVFQLGAGVVGVSATMWLPGGIMSVAMAGLFGFLGITGVQFREGGVVVYGGFLRWRQIDSYSLEDGDTLRIRLRLKRGRLAWLPRPANDCLFTVRSDEKMPIERLLAQYLGGPGAPVVGSVSR